MLASFYGGSMGVIVRKLSWQCLFRFSKSQKERPYYFVWQLQDFNTEDKRGVKSRRILNKINCQTGERKILYSTSHSEHMGKGSVVLGGVSESSWTEPLPKTVGAKLISEVCR